MGAQQGRVGGEPDSRAGTPKQANGFCYICAVHIARASDLSGVPGTEQEVALRLAEVCPACTALLAEITEIRSGAQTRGFSVGI